MKVLITGGSGYLGQHLLASDGAQRPSLEVGYTFCRNPLSAEACGAAAFRMDLTDAASVAEAVSAFAPSVVIHTAAQASPAVAAKDPSGSTLVNAPAALLDALSELDRPPLVVYISTDQVHSGAGGEAPYADAAPCRPVNAYGASKAAFEAMLAAQAGTLPFVVLRSSNMVGPPAPFTGAGKFLQWLEAQLDRSVNPDKVVELFNDEVRSFAHVHDTVRALWALVGVWEEAAEEGGTTDVAVAHGAAPGSARAIVAGWRAGGAVYNMGGPEGLSRLDLAAVLAAARPEGSLPGACSLLLADGATPGVAASSRAALDRELGYASPLDITMDSAALAAVTQVAFRPMRTALALDEGGGGGESGGAVATPGEPLLPLAPALLPEGALRPLSFTDAALLGLFAFVASELIARAASVSPGA